MLGRFGYRVSRLTEAPRIDHYDFSSSVSAFCSGIRARGFRPQNILDIGANRGDWSRIARHWFPDASFTLVEPQVEMKETLDAFCAETASARWIHAGAGAEEGELRLTVLPDQVSSSFAISERNAKEWGLPQRVVRMTTLDRLCVEEIGAIPELVKVDAEGFEYEILKGAQSLFGKTEVFLLELMMLRIHETARPFHEMIAIMADLGYYAYDFTTFIRRPRDGALGVCEIAFVRKDGLLRASLEWN